MYPQPKVLIKPVALYLKLETTSKFNKNQFDDVRDSLNSILESFSTLQDSLTLKDKEIERLRKGYDAEIFKRFLLRFIRAKQAADDLMNESDTSPETKEALANAKKL